MDYKPVNWNVYRVPVVNDYFYKHNLQINNTNCVITFGFNSRLNQRYFNLKATDGTVFIQDTFIKTSCIIKPSGLFDLLDNLETRLYFRKKDHTLSFDVTNWANNIEIFILTIPPEEKDQQVFNEQFLRLP